MRIKAMLVMIFMFCFSPLFCMTGQANTNPVQIQWSTSKITQTMAAGQTKNFSVTIRSNTTLYNADLLVGQVLKPFVSLTPNHFDTLRANTTYKVMVSLNVPNKTKPGDYDGTISLRACRQYQKSDISIGQQSAGCGGGDETCSQYPQTLEVKLDVYANLVPPCSLCGPQSNCGITCRTDFNGCSVGRKRVDSAVGLNCSIHMDWDSPAMQCGKAHSYTHRRHLHLQPRCY